MDARNRKIRLIYGIVLGVLTAAVALAFLIAAADIYYGGPDPAGHNYTYAAFESHLPVPLALLGLWILAIAGGFVLSVLFPVKDVRRPRADEKKALKRLKKRLPREGGEGFAEAVKKVRFHERARIGVWAGVLAFCLAGAVFILVYVFTPSHYSTDVNGDVLRMVKNVMPWVGAGLLLSCAAAFFDFWSVHRELGAAKTAVRTGKAPVSAGGSGIGAWRLSAVKLTVQIAVLAIAVTCIVAGAVNGGAGDVLSKAINICTECIGLG